MAELGAKKQRNYFLDLLKMVGCLLAILVHYSCYVRPYFGYDIWANTFLTPEYATQYTFLTAPKLLGLGGIGSIAVFTFLTGYWFVDSFKKEQRRNTFGRGKDLTIVAKYACKNYAAYWPYILFGVLLHIFITYAMTPELKFFSLYFVKDLILAIPQLFGWRLMGIPGQVFTGTPVTGPGVEAITDYATNTMLTWNSPLWYMFALLVLLPFYYAVFIKNEAFGVFGLTSFMFMAFNVTATQNNAIYTTWQNFGIDNGMFRLGGPMSWGIWGWYIVDFLKKKEFSAKGKTAMNILAVFSIAFVIFQAIEGTGGYMFHDIAYAILLIMILAGKDSVTTGINKALNKIPMISKHFAYISLMVYLLHTPLFYAISYYINHDVSPEFTEFFYSCGPDIFCLICLGILLVLCIPCYFLDKYVLRRLSKWVLTFTKATEPVVIEEPAEAK